MECNLEHMHHKKGEKNKNNLSRMSQTASSDLNPPRTALEGYSFEEYLNATGKKGRQIDMSRERLKANNTPCSNKLVGAKE